MPDAGFRPTPRDYFLIALAAFALRVLIVLCVLGRYHITLTDYANKGDGESYIHYARAILGDPSDLTQYDQRVFPGYPALIALLHCAGIPFPSPH